MKKIFKPRISIVKVEADGDIKKARKKKKKSKEQQKDDEVDFEVIEQFDEDLIIEKEWVPVTSKTRWKCLSCGFCCTRNWRINLTWKEYDRIKDLLNITEMVEDEGTGMSHPIYTIAEKCERYDPDTRLCTIYSDRLYTCAAFPFLLVDKKTLLRSKYCKGFGHGEVVDKKKMKKHITKWRKRAGME